MPWPKGKARGWWANPPAYLSGFECNADELMIPHIGRREVQAMKQAETIEHVESGGHLVAEQYYPGDRVRAESAYKIAKQHESNRRIAVGTKNGERASVPREWIRKNCPDLLADKKMKRTAMVKVIAERMRGDREMEVPGDSTLFRHLAVLLGKKR